MLNNTEAGRGTYILEIATEYGVNESIFISHLWFWIKKNSDAGINFHDQNTWTYSSASKLADRFKHWSRRQIQLIVKKCLDHELIRVGNFNKEKYDKTNWYSLTSKAMRMCQQADNCPLISNFQNISEKDHKIIEQRKVIEEQAKTIEMLTSAQNEPLHQVVPPLHQVVPPIPNILPVILNSVCIKKDCLIGNSKTSESPHRQQPSFEKNEQAQDLILQHMLTHPHGCSPEKIKAYRAHRGYRMSTKTWDSAIATLMTIAKEKLPHLSPDDVLDAMLSRHDCCTDFDMLFPEAKQAANITRFEKKAASYNTTPGQSLESVLSDLKRMGGEHNIPQDYDYQDLYNRIFFTNSSNNQHVIFSQEKKGRIETSEPAWRQQARQELGPETLRLLSLSKSNVNTPRIHEEIETDDSKGSAIKSHKDPSVLFTKVYTGTIPEAIGESAPDNPREQEKHPSSIQDLLLMFSKGNTKKKAEPSANHFGEYGDPSEALRATRDRILTKDYSFNERVSPSY